MKNWVLFFCFCFLFQVTGIQAQNTGVKRFDTVAAMNAFTPNVVQNQAMLALVTSGSIVSTVYSYNQPTSSWIRVGDISVTDGATIDLTYTSGNLTAELSQNGANVDQVMIWNGSEWEPDDISINATGVSFSSSNFTASQVGAALEELFVLVDGVFSIGGVFNSDALAASGGIDLNAFYTAGDDHRDGVREGTVIRRNY